MVSLRGSLGAIWLVSLSFIAACGDEGDASVASASIENPSGACGTRSDGGRAGYHAPGSDVWLPDCKAPLKREYFRVFARSSTSAYTIPRLDGQSLLVAPCGDAQHALRPLVEKYGLCQPAMSVEQVDIVNHMLPGDALALTHFLHTVLRFTAPGEASIEPFPLPSDIVDACELKGRTNSPELEAMCQRERDRLASGSGIGFSYTGPAASQLAARLNELYGI